MNEEFIKERLGDENAVCNQIKFERDAIIEASAGTGKTYTLQSIVLRLLTKGIVDSVKNLLLVTYTEKAAGELKDRIRKVLVDAGCLPPDFDEVTICTIHSFCRELLTEYAFENRVPMQTEICASDKDLIHQALLEAVHSDEYLDGVPGGFVATMQQAGLTTEALVEMALERWGKPLPQPGARAGAQTVAKASLVNALMTQAKAVFERNKAQTSVLTFDDLVTRAGEVIDAEAANEAAGRPSELLTSIRRRYRIALVDEFQDTDDRQWSIFRNIFSHRVNRIAGGAKPLQGSLLVVGDPKQAIYSFRGADIGAYLRAKAYITDSEKGQPVRTLDTTFRSTPELVKGFNKMFGTTADDGTGWFVGMSEEDADGEITYSAVNPPPKDNAKFHKIEYAQDFGGHVELIESLPCQLEDPRAQGNGGYGNAEVGMPVFLRNAAREMKRLKGLPWAFRTTDPKTGEVHSRRLGYGDMCILVRGATVAAMARRALLDAGIPFSIYKEKGLFASSEAESLLALFDFLSVPSRRGRREALLLTPFFGTRPDQLEARLAGSDRAFSDLVEKWETYVAKHEWERLFESVMDDTQLARPRAGDPEFDRRWAATRQILDNLLVAKGGSARAIDEFADELRSWRENDARAGEDGSLRKRESQADCVQIMTMHVSKGLEFPVVFLAWGANVVGYKVEKEEKPQAFREEKRLLYVALTRAEHKLYLPWSQWASHNRIRKVDGVEKCCPEVGIGSIGSGLLIPDQFKRENRDHGFLAKGILVHFDGAEKAKQSVLHVQTRAETQADTPSAGEEDAPERKPVAVQPRDIPEYKLDPEDAARQRLQYDSFSSLHRRAQAAETMPETAKENDEQGAEGQANRKREPTLLPRNNISGDVFHEIMETLCKADDSAGAGVAPLGFVTAGSMTREALLQDTRFLELVRRTMRRHAVTNQENKVAGDSTEKVLGRMVWRALNTPIRIGDAAFMLKDVQAGDRRAEMEFVVNRPQAMGTPLDSGDPQADSAFNGKIDLLVRPRGRDGLVYVLDWKTNSLADYGDASVAAAMDAADYHLQYRFYSLAVQRWLGEEKLGGVAYLFVRAGEQVDAPDIPAGVFAVEGDKVNAQACRTAIGEALKNGGR